MATTNKDMGDMMRGRRAEMNEYMYEDPGTSLDVEDSGADITVLGPDDADDPAKFTYEPVGNGAWMVYPPGVPCETGAQRVQMSGPAQAADFGTMQSMLDENLEELPEGETVATESDSDEEYDE